MYCNVIYSYFFSKRILQIVVVVQYRAENYFNSTLTALLLFYLSSRLPLNICVIMINNET